MKKHWNYIAGILLLVLILTGSTACGASSNQADQYIQDVSLSAEHAWTGATPTEGVTEEATVTPIVDNGLTDFPEEDQETGADNTADSEDGEPIDDDSVFTPTDVPEEGDTDLSSLTATPTEIPTTEPTATLVPTTTIAPSEPAATTEPTATLVPADTSADTEPQVPAFTGVSYVVMDPVTGEIMLSSDADKQIYPASTIKLLTALTALDYLDMDEVITADQSLLDQVEFDAYQYGVVAGSTYTLDVWMHMLLISSCGDAADVIANAAGGSLEGFAKLMNQKAQALGLTNTKADNAIGLDIGNDYDNMYSTATDIAKLAVIAMKNDAICDIVAKAEYTVPACDAMDSKVIESTNWYLTRSDTYSSDYFTAIGTKSGSTDAAGSCYVATVVNDEGKEYICAYFGGTSKDTVFREMTAFFEYTYKYLT